MLFWPLPGVPPVVPPADGRFAGVRRYDLHTGIDLYAPEKSLVVAMEPGAVVNIQDFTGPDAGSPWWLPTKAVLVRGRSGVILYGEVDPVVQTGDQMRSGSILGSIARVLRIDKGRPTSMLHLELYESHVTSCCDFWKRGDSPPAGLLNPESLLSAYLSLT